MSGGVGSGRRRLTARASLAAFAVLGGLAIVAVPAAALQARAASVGPAPATQPLTIALPLRAHDAALATFAQEVSTPDSPLYGRYESIAAAARRFGASVTAQRRVISFLRAHGATRVSVDPTGLLAHATMTVSTARRMFEAPLGQFRAADGSRFVAPTATVTVPAALRGLVEGVVGLDTAPVARDRVDSRSQATASAFNSVLGLSGTPSGCAGARSTEGFTPNQYLAAYGYEPLRDRGLDGQGERLALVEIDGLRDSDLLTFANCFGLDRPAYTTYAVGGLRHYLAPGGEATLDFEVANSVAPELRQIEVFETANSDAGILDAIAAPLYIPGDKPDVISNSIGLCEPAYQQSDDLGGVHAQDRELQFMATVGISFVSAAGDNGSADCSGRQSRDDHALAVDYPGSSPWATDVGGTNLVLSPANQILSQLVWNDAGTAPDYGGGGGFSVLHKRPSYQAGVVAGDRRALPDVAMLADPYPGYAFYCTAKRPECLPDSPWSTTGGTSAAAPLLASGLLLVDQDLARASRERIGFANPLLYHFGESSLRSAIFSDVTDGTNDTGPYFGTHTALGCCTAVPGFDQASGWGSVDLANFDSAVQTLQPIVSTISIRVPAGQRSVHAGQLTVTLGCNRACSVGAVLDVTVEDGPQFVVSTPLLRLSTGQTTRVHFRFGRRQERELRAALAAHHGIFGEVFGIEESGSRTPSVVTPAKQVTIR